MKRFEDYEKDNPPFGYAVRAMLNDLAEKCEQLEKLLNKKK